MSHLPDSMLDEAVLLAGRGWAVLPMHSPLAGGRCSCDRLTCKNVAKHPKISGGVHSASCDPAQLNRWFKKWPIANIGIATGAVSGIVVLDEDPRHGSEESIEKLEKKHGKLPDTVESITGGGGRHRVFKHPGIPIKNDSAGVKLGAGLDIRGDGGIIVAPPSEHVTGRRYAWELSSHPDDVALAPLPDWMIEALLNRKIDRETERTEKTEDTEETERTEAIASVSPSLCLSVSDAIKATLPTNIGQRNRKIFDFARALKSVPGMMNATLPTLKPAVREWHKSAIHVIGTQPFDETWEEFSYCWPRVRIGAGENALTNAIARANTAELPSVAANYDSPVTHRLLKICQELQRLNGADPFFLSCRVAGRVLGIDHESANKRLNMLVSDGVLLITKAGTTRTATRYRMVTERKSG